MSSGLVLKSSSQESATGGSRSSYETAPLSFHQPSRSESNFCFCALACCRAVSVARSDSARCDSYLWFALSIAATTWSRKRPTLPRTCETIGTRKAESRNSIRSTGFSNRRIHPSPGCSLSGTIRKPPMTFSSRSSRGLPVISIVAKGQPSSAYVDFRAGYRWRPSFHTKQKLGGLTKGTRKGLAGPLSKCSCCPRRCPGVLADFGVSQKDKNRKRSAPTDA